MISQISTLFATFDIGSRITTTTAEYTSTSLKGISALVGTITIGSILIKLIILTVVIAVLLLIVRHLIHYSAYIHAQENRRNNGELARAIAYALHELEKEKKKDTDHPTGGDAG